MREHMGLYRGKRKDNGEWLEGAFCPKNSEGDIPCIIVYNGNWAGYWFEVDPDTVGECCGGLRDKNGKLIFEGDIVRILGNQASEDWKCVDYNALIAFLDGGFCALDGTIKEHGFRRYALCRMDFDLDIIGNIHDNPELLKGGEQ